MTVKLPEEVFLVAVTVVALVSSTRASEILATAPVSLEFTPPKMTAAKLVLTDEIVAVLLVAPVPIVMATVCMLMTYATLTFYSLFSE